MPDRKSRHLTQRKTRHPWVSSRKMVQFVSLLVFVLVLLFSRTGGLPPAIASIPVKLSPLAMISQLLSNKTFLIGSTISLIILLSSLIVGRAWCGWLCPIGTILDFFPLNSVRKRPEIKDGFRKIKFGLLIVILISAIFGNLTLLVFDPITIFTRSATLTFFPVIDKVVYFLEKQLSTIPFLSESVYKFDAWIRPLIFPVESTFFQYAFLYGLVFVAIILLNLFAERFWCRYICPLGAMLGMTSRVSLIQRRITGSCTECGLCASSCPTGTIDPKNNFKSDPSECILCMNCLYSCNRESLSFSAKLSKPQKMEYDPGRRMFFTMTGAAIFSVALMGIDWINNVPKTHLLRPPGTDPETFLSKCIRCGLCMKVCPTQAIQAGLTESGVEGIGSPIIVPRNGYCSFACNTCGVNCPVEAIPPLSIQEKQKSVIGHAYIEENRCIAWSDHLTCLVCEEMCPLPEKAITLQKGSFFQTDGSVFNISLPIVNREICIGCGTCENKCPVSGEAAIRVYTL